MARIREEEYAYATARIRVRELKLMSQSRIERLFEVKDYSEAIKLLVESGYGNENIEASKDGAKTFEDLLSLEMMKTYDLLINMIPDPEEINLFRKKYDYLNAKLILKAELLKIDVLKTLSKMGTIEPEKLYSVISERKLEELSTILRTAIVGSLESFNIARDPQIIDFTLDKACYAEMSEDAKKSGDPFLEKIVNMLVDAANLRILIRSKMLSKSYDFIKNAWVDGGVFSVELFKEMENKEIDKLFLVLKNLGYEKLAIELSKAIQHPDGISEIERILDDYITLYLKQSKFVTMGIEPVVGYLFFKETEIKNTRLIITGIMNKVSRETIKERLRVGYA